MITAGFFLLVASFVDPGLLPRLSSQAGTVTMGFVIVSGFLAAQGIRRFAAVFLKDKAPWYAVAVFLCIAVPCINPLFTKLDDFLVGAGMIEQVTSQPARMFLFMAFELLWIAWLVLWQLHQYAALWRLGPKGADSLCPSNCPHRCVPRSMGVAGEGAETHGEGP